MALARTAFGKPMREHFQFADDFVPINHGAFGVAPRYVREVARDFQDKLERRPDVYLRYGYPQDSFNSRKVAASYLNADVDDVVYVPNASTGVNTVLRSLVWKPGDVIIYWDAVYGAVLKTIQYLEESTPVKAHLLNTRFPVSDDELLSVFEKTVKEINAVPGQRVRLAVLDTVTSMPAVIIPFEQMVSKCKELGVMSFVDGAHGIGLVPIDLKQLDPDFFVSNLHKWLFVPRSCAALYVPKRNQALIRSSLPTSHSFEPLGGSAPTGTWPSSSIQSSPFVKLFEFVGTLDTQHYMAVPAALEWREKVCGGEEAIRDYCCTLARAAGKLVAEILGTEVMRHEGVRLEDCAFINVRLPIEIGDGEGQVRKEDVHILHEWITHYSTVCADSYFQVAPYHGAFWTRLSAQVYNDIEDFKQAGQWLKAACDKIRLGRDQYVKDGKCKLCVKG